MLSFKEEGYTDVELLLSCRFVVMMDAFTFGFQSVSDIALANDVRFITEGGRNDYPIMQRQQQTTPHKLTFKRGYQVRRLGFSAELLNMAKISVLTRRGAVGMILVLNDEMDIRAIYGFVSQGLIEWNVSELNAERSEVLIESFTIAHNGLTNIPVPDFATSLYKLWAGVGNVVGSAVNTALTAVGTIDVIGKGIDYVANEGAEALNEASDTIDEKGLKKVEEFGEKVDEALFGTDDESTEEAPTEPEPEPQPEPEPEEPSDEAPEEPGEENPEEQPEEPSEETPEGPQPEEPSEENPEEPQPEEPGEENPEEPQPEEPSEETPEEPQEGDTSEGDTSDDGTTDDSNEGDTSNDGATDDSSEGTTSDDGTTDDSSEGDTTGE